MFGFFKKKVKNAFDEFAEQVDEEAEDVEDTEEIVESKVEEKSEEDNDQPEETNEEESEQKENKQSFLKKINPFKKKSEEESTEEEKQDEVVKSKVEEKSDIKETKTDSKKTEVKTKVEDKVKKSEPNNKVKTETKPEEKNNSEELEADEKVESELKKSFLSKISNSITKKTLSEDKFHDLFWNIEIALLENNVAFEVVELIKSDLNEKLVNTQLQRSKISEIIEETLKETVDKLFDQEDIDLVKLAVENKPLKILIVGINGAGKTTTIGKLCKLFLDNNLKPVVAAADTFRAAAIDQIQEHTDNLGVKLIKHDYGSDPAAVAFDAIKYAEAKKQDVVLIDTAGRLHSNTNLMEELKKVHRVSEPDLTIFVGESITGNDCVEQAKEFNKIVDIDGIILSKADIDEKGGAAISISYVLKKPILYLGMGQDYSDLEKFDKYRIMYRMFGTDLEN